MKRDIELIRTMLIEIEETDLMPMPIYYAIHDVEGTRHSGLIGDDEMQTEIEHNRKAYHWRVMLNAGLLDVTSADNTILMLIGLSNDGHDLLNAIREEASRNQLKERFGNEIFSQSLEVIKQAGVKLASEYISNL